MLPNTLRLYGSSPLSLHRRAFDHQRGRGALLRHYFPTSAPLPFPHIHSVPASLIVSELLVSAACAERCLSEVSELISRTCFIFFLAQFRPVLLKNPRRNVVGGRSRGSARLGSPRLELSGGVPGE